MKKILFLSCIFLTLANSGTTPFSDFKSNMNDYNKNLYARKFTNQDALAWWNIMDGFLSSLLSNVLKNTVPDEYFKNKAGKTIDSIIFSYYHNQWSGDDFGLGYHIARPPDGIDQGFGFGIIPMSADHSSYFVTYNCAWRLDPQPGDASSPVSTFRILQKNSSAGTYQIVARNEDTNFYKQIITKGKLKHADYMKPPYMWVPTLLRESMKYDKAKLTFDVKYSLCYPSAPCYHDVTVSYVYTYANKKLIATKYREVEERVNYDWKIGQYIPKDITVPLSP